MSDDEVDYELLDLLRQRLGIADADPDAVSSETGVLKDAQFIYNNAIDVSVDMLGTKAAASEIYGAMRQKGYSTETWSQHELHPKPSEHFTEIDIVNFVFTMDLLNFSFWSEFIESERFQVDYRDKRWTGYNSLVACLRRALDENIPITTPRFWRTHHCSDALLSHVFRSATEEQIPLLNDRIAILREASQVLRQSFSNVDEVDEADEIVDLEDKAQRAVRSEPMHTSNARDTIDLVRQDGISNDCGPQDNDLVHDIDRPAEVAISSSNTTDALDLAAVTSGLELDFSLSFRSLQRTPLDSTQPAPDDTGSEPAASSVIPEIEPVSGIASGLPGVGASVSSDQQDASQHVSPTASRRQSGDEESRERSTQIHDLEHIALKADHSVVRMIEKADRSAGKLVNLLAKHFTAFRDESRFEGKNVRILKRAQIFVADLWAALNGDGLGAFHDIDHLTMFADYRVPQCLHSLGVLSFSPPLEHHIRAGKLISSGHPWEVQLRGCSIWAVELIRREIARLYPEAEESINAVLIDFFLYDLAKEREAQGMFGPTRSRTRP